MQLIQLEITVQNKTYTELINTISAPDVTAYKKDYQLLLEKYIDRDYAQVRIIATALDRSLPRPLLGKSQPIILNTVSAYGRYQDSLKTIYELKKVFDVMRENRQTEVTRETSDLARKAFEQSKETPFFDYRDRSTLQAFVKQIDRMQEKTPDFLSILNLAQNITNFLLEHELIDDRERDRDFFVAARSLSRILSEPKNQRQTDPKEVSDRIVSFLKDRQDRWQKRVSRLHNPDSLKLWPQISKGDYFTKIYPKLLQEDKKSPKQSNALSILSRSVEKYREWITELEIAEDKTESRARENRRQGLVSAQKSLVKLQKKQGVVSSQLDKAATKSPNQLKNQWPITRLHQNSTLSEAKQLEAKLRALAPLAAERMRAAVQAMGSTITRGNDKNYTQAETSADLAGRLLRQTQKDARQAARSQTSRRGRRRRVSGNNYYGQAIHGGDIDIERNYKVDSRYRREILEEVYEPSENPDNRLLLDGYLRQIVR